MSATPATGEIAQQVTNYPVFHRWNEAAANLTQTIEEAPFQDPEDSFDRTNGDHLAAQMQINNAAAEEQSFRSHLRLELASGTDDNLDLLARLSLLHAIDRFNPQPKTEIVRIAVLGERIPVRLGGIFNLATHPKEKPLPDPSSVAETLQLADIVDATIRAVRSVLRKDKPNKITVAETHMWSELRSLQRLHHARQSSGSIVTNGILAPDQIPSLSAPTVCTDGAVYYELPYDLPNVTVISQEPKPRGTSSYLYLTETPIGKTTTVPLLAAMLAQGRDITQYQEPGYGVHGGPDRKMKIIVNGHIINNDPRSYIA